jgi:molecular chaperone DnaJ
LSGDLRLPNPDPYQVLGVHPNASSAEIKAAYRALVKQHHPDAGGDEHTILALNAAWEVLGDAQRRAQHDCLRAPAPQHSAAQSAAAASRAARKASAEAARGDGLLLAWLQQVYAPIDRLLAQVINPFPAQLKALSADPYDDALMEAFCAFLEQSHCFSQVQDAVTELERYTMGYVDSYLRDGREMLREAKRRRSLLQEERRRLDL